MPSVLVQIAVTLVAWLILMLVGTNLLSFFVRGLFVNPQMENIASANDILMQDYKKSQSANKYINVVAFVLIVIFLASLYRFWNIALVVSALPELWQKSSEHARSSKGALAASVSVR